MSNYLASPRRVNPFYRRGKHTLIFRVATRVDGDWGEGEYDGDREGPELEAPRHALQQEFREGTELEALHRALECWCHPGPTTA